MIATFLYVFGTLLLAVVGIVAFAAIGLLCLVGILGGVWEVARYFERTRGQARRWHR